MTTQFESYVALALRLADVRFRKAFAGHSTRAMHEGYFVVSFAALERTSRNHSTLLTSIRHLWSQSYNSVSS
jgi:hypothetical protein